MIRTVAILPFALAACAAPSFTARVPRGPDPQPGSRVAVVVRVPAPWYAPRFVVRGKFREALPEYEALPGLESKWFSISDAGEFGGLYLWSSRAAAERQFDAAWHERVRRVRGVEARVELFDAPFVVEGPALPLGTPVGSRSLEVGATATLTHTLLPAGADRVAEARRLAEGIAAREGLIRAFALTTGSGVGLLGLWASRGAAEGFASAAAPQAEVVLFEAPLLVDASLRAGR